MLSYRKLDGPSQLAVQLKDRRLTYRQISDELFAGYGLERSPETIRNWFRPSSGRLSVAIEQWREMLAKEGLRSAVLLLQRYSLPAVVVLGELMKHKNPRIRLMAATAILNKTIPNATTSAKRRRRMVRGEPGIPAEFMQAAYDDQQREPEDRIGDDEDWDNFLNAVRVQNYRIAISESNRSQPFLA